MARLRRRLTLRSLSVAKSGNVPSIVLCHNPDAADEPVWDDYQGWILAGHTHGGQCKPPFLPPPELPVKNRRYTAGEFGLSGNRRMYISRGVGHLLRVRFNARPEIPIFSMRARVERNRSLLLPFSIDGASGVQGAPDSSFGILRASVSR